MRWRLLSIGCRLIRAEGLQEVMGGGQERKRRWLEVGRRTQGCCCCLWGRDRLLAIICPSEPSSELPIKMMDSCEWMEESGLKGPAPMHSDFSQFGSDRLSAVCAHNYYYQVCVCVCAVNKHRSILIVDLCCIIIILTVPACLHLYYHYGIKARGWIHLQKNVFDVCNIYYQ